MRKSIESVIGNTPIIELKQFDTGQCRLFAKLESQNPSGSVKDRIALSMINAAEAGGRIRSGYTLVEGTAGNTGISLAMVGMPRGYSVCCVVPDKMSVDKIHSLEGMGVTVRLTRSDVGLGHPEHFLQLSKTIAAENPGHYFIDQFSNEANVEAHFSSTGPEIWRQMQGDVDSFICGVGTGGTITGVGRYLKQQDQAIEIILADPKGSILANAFDQTISKDNEAWLSEGIGTSFLPALCDFSVIDKAVVVDAFQTARFTHELLHREGVFAGPSTGAVLAAAITYCQMQLQPRNVVMLVADDGQRYIDTIYNKQWLQAKGVSLAAC